MFKRESALARRGAYRDPFSLLRQLTADLDRVFEDTGWPTLRRPAAPMQAEAQPVRWLPNIDVFERENRLVTKIDLPGMKKEDVKVEVTDDQLTISGERRSETEEKGEQVYRCEREYGSFYRSVPLPEGVKIEDVKASFADGVLEVSIPLPAKKEARARKVEIEETPSPAKTAA